MNTGPRRRNFETQPVDRPGGAFARQEDIAAIWRVLHNVQVGNQRGICNRDSLLVPNPVAEVNATSWRMWYSGGLLWVQPGRFHVLDHITGIYEPQDFNSFPGSTWADRTATALAVDPSSWSISPTGTAVYFFYQWPTRRAIIETTFGRGITLDSGPSDWGTWYSMSDGWRRLYLGTIHSGSSGIYVTPAYPAAFDIAKGMQSRFRVLSLRLISWANNSGTGMNDAFDILGVSWSPGAELPLNSQGYLYYQEVPAYPGTGSLSLSVADFCVGYYVTDSIGLLYLWETPLANLQPIP